MCVVQGGYTSFLQTVSSLRKLETELYCSCQTHILLQNEFFREKSLSPDGGKSTRRQRMPYFKEEYWVVPIPNAEASCGCRVSEIARCPPGRSLPGGRNFRQNEGKIQSWKSKGQSKIYVSIHIYNGKNFDVHLLFCVRCWVFTMRRRANWWQLVYLIEEL